MSRRAKWITFLLLLAVGVASVTFAQRRGFRRSVAARGDFPAWSNETRFEKDLFTFARIEYDNGYSRNWQRGNGWATDYRDAGLNLSYRLQQLPSMKVDPEGRRLRLT